MAERLADKPAQWELVLGQAVQPALDPVVELVLVSADRLSVAAIAPAAARKISGRVIDPVSEPVQQISAAGIGLAVAAVQV